jgi:hypothetical protein
MTWLEKAYQERFDPSILMLPALILCAPIPDSKAFYTAWI